LFEKGVIETYRSAGMGWDWFRKNEVMFYVVSVSCDYMKPVRLDDILDIEVTVNDPGNSSLSYDVRMFRTHRSGMHPDESNSEVPERELVAKGRLVHVFTGSDGSPRKLPSIICEKFGMM